MVSTAVQARRALVKVLVALASLYSVSVRLSRDSTDTEVTAAFRKVVLKAHPDKGGTEEHAKQLNEAKAKWDSAKRRGGRPQQNSPGQPQPSTSGANTDAPGAAAASSEDAWLQDTTPKSYRIHSVGVLLTYFGVEGLPQWNRFAAHVRSQQKAWNVKYWSATLERTTKGKLHIHLMLQFTKAVDRSNRIFSFESMVPRADCNDLLGGGICRKRMQESINRGMFYCWADKIGTERDEEGRPCTAGNYEPAWTGALLSYPVKSRWAQDLWQAYKLTDNIYEDYLFKSRDGVLPKKRNLDACRERAARAKQTEEIEARTKRIRTNTELFPGFPPIPKAQAWLDGFKEDKIRYPVLVVLGKSHTGKTEWAQTLFRTPLVLKVGTLEHFPESMRSFDREVHDGVVLDDLRDLKFLVAHQDKLQGKYNSLVEFASTPGGGLAYWRDLFRVPVAATCNFSTANLRLLLSDDFLGNPQNRTLVRFPPKKKKEGEDEQQEEEEEEKDEDLLQERAGEAA